jgi:hypothetical protein
MESSTDVKAKSQMTTKDQESLLVKGGSALTPASNAVFHHFLLFGKTFKLSGFSDLFYLTISFISTGLTFGLMMWYFSTAACVPTSLTYPGNPAQESFTLQVFTPPMTMCVTFTPRRLIMMKIAIVHVMVMWTTAQFTLILSLLSLLCVRMLLLPL